MPYPVDPPRTAIGCQCRGLCDVLDAEPNLDVYTACISVARPARMDEDLPRPGVLRRGQMNGRLGLPPPDSGLRPVAGAQVERPEQLR